MANRNTCASSVPGSQLAFYGYTGLPVWAALMDLEGAMMIDKLYAFVLALAGISFGSYIMLHEVSESIRGDSGMLESSAARRSEC
ncbi:putative membrane protein (plasmid) [Rhodococcus opacus]|uniref:Putative membrane protein n=1 Tax=Rhodococcus opacus TaxID=37919 RepID=A0A1B1KJ25_RHOOP|nr:putative membrane protein [Rhodococcus opacus]